VSADRHPNHRTRNSFLRLPLVGILLLSFPVAWAGIITEATRTFTVGTDIADVQDPPVSFLQTITDSGIASLTRVDIGLNLVGRDSGGFAGEMFVSLNKNLSLTSVLANRVGFSGTDSIGLPYDGWNVTFSDLAASDLHTVVQTSGVLTGTYQPDGRTDPTGSLRPELLSVFAGETGNGDWRLNVADLGVGGTMRLVGWSLTLTGVEIPEANTYAAGIAVILAVGGAWWRRTRRR
jgi:hypothetical protein